MRRFEKENENDRKACFVLNDTLKCMCETATHGVFEFGQKRDHKINEYIYFDDVNCIDISYDCCNVPHYKLFNKQNSLLTDEDLYKLTYNEEEYKLYKSIENTEQKYFKGCKCDYCFYKSNLELDIYNTCFCCKKKVYTNDIGECSDCGSILCYKCYVRGRYHDKEDGTFCYECRKFGFNKNSKFYYNEKLTYRDSKIITRDDDWDKASWYY